jgi:hypothetical protein
MRGHNHVVQHSMGSLHARSSPACVSGSLTSSFGKLPGIYRGINGLERHARLNVVVDGSIHLLLAGQPVTPLLFQADDC